MAHGTQKDWRELCLEVTNEQDSTKLSSLVQQLIEALDQGQPRLASLLFSGSDKRYASAGK